MPYFLCVKKAIPTITDILDASRLISLGTELLVDGSRGTLVIAPNAATRAEFQERMEKWGATSPGVRRPVVSRRGRSTAS